MSLPEILLTGGLSAGLLTLIVLYVLALRRNTALINKLAEIAAKYVHIKNQAEQLAVVVKRKNVYIEKVNRELAGLADASQLVSMFNRMLADGAQPDDGAALPNEPSPK